MKKGKKWKREEKGGGRRERYTYAVYDCHVLGVGLEPRINVEDDLEDDVQRWRVMVLKWKAHDLVV